jgi:hypothetical protein
MGKRALGRVLDPSALDACPGPRARLSIEVPASWLAEGAELRVTAPARLVCARCDGGGCDACARAGALRSPAEAADRVVRARLPSALGGDPPAIALRIPDPFGPEHEIAQLVLEVRSAARPSACVSRVAPAPLVRATAERAQALPWPVFAAAVIAAVLFAVCGR